jgi:hypothetical protein
MDADRENVARANPAALTPADVARLLGVAEDVVQKHLAEGVPRAADGTMNLVHYAAWLNREPPDDRRAGLADGD